MKGLSEAPWVLPLGHDLILNRGGTARKIKRGYGAFRWFIWHQGPIAAPDQAA